MGQNHTDVEKASYKIQNLFTIKTLNEQGREGKFLNPMKGIYRKPHS